MTMLNNTQSKSDVKDVAIYLRKSRGEEEDLAKHRMALEELCKVQNWRYTEYAEIGTSDSIDLRPKMIQLLKDVGQELYDAVIVMDMDRLSRGDGEEQARIKNTMRRTSTLIITPNKIYDLEDENDDMYSDFEGLMARVEYKQIKKRFKRGKKQGSRRGDWTNGTPPYPYEYKQWFDTKSKELHSNEKGLVVNKEKYNIYRYIMEKIIVENVSPNEVSWELNKQGIPSPRGGIWHGGTIQRILVDETHLGKIISNKSAGDGHIIKRSKDCKALVYYPREEWIVVDNCHEAVKTEEEHTKILMYFNRITKTPKRRGTRTYPLSGLVKCCRCGHTLVTGIRADRSNAENIKPCWYKDEFGNKCGNRGGEASIVHEAIKSQLALYETALKQTTSGNDESNTTLTEVNITLNEIDKLERKSAKIDELVEEEYYTLTEAKQRKSDNKLTLDKAETRLKLLQIKLGDSQKMDNQERLNLIDKFREGMAKDNITAEEVNDWYKSLISHIIWDRKDDTYIVKVNFL